MTTEILSTQNDTAQTEPIQESVPLDVAALAKHYDTFSARMNALRSKDTPPELTALLLSAEWAKSMDLVRQSFETSGENISQSDIEAAGVLPVMQGLLNEIPLEGIQAVYKLPESERGDFDKIIELASRRLRHDIGGSVSTEDRLNFGEYLARITGYPSILAMKDAGVDINGITNTDMMISTLTDDSNEQAKMSVAHNVLHELSAPTPDDLMIAMYARLTDKNVEAEIDILDTKKLKTWLMNISDKMHHIGPENAKLLRDKCGIVNFADMPDTLLDRMVKFVHGDEELLEHLRSHECAVMIKDGSNDGNGAFRGSYERYETTDRALLVFELPSQGTATSERGVANSIYDKYYLLNQHEIEPALVVVEGHGSPGSIDMGGTTIGTNGRLALADSGLLSIITHMKPDRDGNCSVVFESCSQDAPGEGGYDDTMLTRTARDIIAAMDNTNNGNTYQLYGVNKRYSTLRDAGGTIVARAHPDDQEDELRVGHVIITSTGAVWRYQHDNPDRNKITLPMFAAS